MVDPQMPKTGAGEKERRDIRLPKEIWERIDAIAEHEGEPPASVLREVVKLGLPEKEHQVLESDNKRRINRRLRAKEGGAMDFVKLFRDVATTPEQQAALDKLEQWLSKG